MWVRDVCLFSKCQPHWASMHKHSQVRQFPQSCPTTQGPSLQPQWVQGAILRTTDFLLRRQHTTTACSSTEAMLTKHAPLQNKSAECKRSQSRFQHTTDHPFQLLVQGNRYKPPKKFPLKCIGAFEFPHLVPCIPLQKICSWFSWQITT